MVQWVAALVRLAVLRYIEKPAPDDPPTRSKGSVAEALDLLMERHVTPFATFEVRARVRGRGRVRVRAGVRAALDPLCHLRGAGLG